MARACVVCSHPAAADIHAALRSGSIPVLQLAATHELSRDSLNFCRRRHLPDLPAAARRQSQPGPTLLPHGGQSRAYRGSPEVTRGDATNRARERFLKAYADCGNVTAAAKQAGIGRKTVYVWLEHSDEFAAAMKQADIQATETLEREAWRRARDGFAEPVYQHGKLVGTVQRFSDALIMFLLKARVPERYGSRVDVTLTPTIKAVAGFDPADVI